MGDLDVKSQIEFTLRGAAAKEAVDALKRLSSQAKDTKQSLGVMGEAAQSVGSTLTRYLGAAAIGALVRTSVSEFAKLERMWESLELQMRSLGLETQKSLPQIKAVLQAIQEGGGALVSETLPAFTRFVGITKDTNTALFATKLAASIAEDGIHDMGSGADALAQVLQGRAIGAAQALGIEFRKINGDAKSNDEILDEVISKYGDLGDAFDDTQNALDKANSGWTDFKNAVGDGFSVFAQVGGALDVIVKGIKSIGPLFVAASAVSAEFFIGLGSGAAQAVLGLKTLITQGPGAYIAAIKNAFTTGLGSLAPELTGALDEFNAIWAKGGEKGAIDEVAARKKILDQAHRKELEEERKAAAEKAKVEAKAMADAEEEITRAAAEGAQKRADLEEQTETQIIEQKLALASAGTEEALRLELDLLERKKEAALSNAATIGAETNAIEEFFQLARFAIIDRYSKDAAQAELDNFIELARAKHEAEQAGFDVRLGNAAKDQLAIFALQRQQALDQRNFETTENDAWRESELQKANGNAARIAAINDIYNQKKLASDRAYSAATNAITRNEAEYKKQQYFAAAQAAVGALTTIFGQNKATAIASAIVNTALGVSQALTLPFPLDFIVAALVAAAGAVQIRKITSTNVGSAGQGFDDPANDRLAYQGGRRWAEDFIRLSSRGFGDGISELSPAGSGGLSQSYTYHYGAPHEEYHFHAPVITNRDLRELSRMVKRGDVLDQGRSIR